ncbi:CHAT domain-containing protein [Streptomyces spinoverrucosus]|uniref:CHAT domain-containing protein n=1 Tax=Streptomyces spinoverrucosus TaxID=284043 RepID=UPI0018C41898|nr:CHAT domain-containing protein [Streptomyces spinoverrucosus]MBG0851297.1 CHAT domain-containing protein [Streptomyces spinoverrucosus]
MARSQEAFDLTPDHSPQWWRACHYYEQAIAAVRPRSPEPAALSYNLAVGLRLRHDRGADARDRRRAAESLRRAARIGLAHSPQVALLAARTLGDWAAEREAWDESARAYAIGLKAMHRLVRAQTTRAQRETWLRRAQRLPARAAFAMVTAGRATRAATGVEHGRALVLSAYPDQPLDSALLLAQSALTLRDVLEQRLTSARVAVLSACESALSGTALPDEAVGLPTGLSEAGAAGVVGSPWRVPDITTTVLVSRFYQNWRQGGLEPAHYDRPCAPGTDRTPLARTSSFQVVPRGRARGWRCRRQPPLTGSSRRGIAAPPGHNGTHNASAVSHSYRSGTERVGTFVTQRVV